VPSWPNQLVAVEATTIDWASIILPMTPPEELAAAIRIGGRLSCSEVIFGRLPNKMFDAVSEPVSATPSQPEQGAEEGIEHAGGREGEAKRGVDAGQPGQRSDRQHRRDGDERVGAELDGPSIGHRQARGREAHQQA